MANKPKTHTKILLILKDLHIGSPKLSIGHHLGLACAEQGDIFNLSDKELLSCLEKYKSELEINTVPDDDLERIIEEGKNLDKLFERDEFLD